MGFVATVAGKIRDFFAKDKELVRQKLSTGVKTNAMPFEQRDLLLGFGGEGLLGGGGAYSDHDLAFRYSEYESMDDFPEIATVLDIFADDASQPDTQLNRVVWIEAQDEEVRTVLDDLLQNRLRIDEDVWEIIRTLCKYGSDYEEILVDEEGVIGLNFLPPPTVRRIEDRKGTLLGFLQSFREDYKPVEPATFLELLELKKSNSEEYARRTQDPQSPWFDIAVFEPWEIAHFRLRSKFRKSVYGHSILEPARWVWKRLTLLEDSAVLFRLTKAVERYAFYIDVGDKPAQEALAYVNKVRQSYKKKKYVNPTTGQLELRFDPLTQDDDLFIPSRGGQESTRVDVLGSPQWQDMSDIEYFRTKLLGCVKVPSAYLGAEAGMSRAILSNEDVRFARTVLRVQRAFQTGVNKVGRIHLAARNIDPEASRFDTKMTVPSAIFELAQLEVRNARADLAARMADFVSLRWILVNIFHLGAEEVQLVMDERSQDAIRNAVAAGKGEAEAQKLVMAATGGGGEVPEGEEGEEGEEEGGGYGERRKFQMPRRVLRERVPRQPNSEDMQAQQKLDEILRNDQKLAKRLHELARLLKEIHRVSGKRASH